MDRKLFAQAALTSELIGHARIAYRAIEEIRNNSKYHNIPLSDDAQQIVDQLLSINGELNRLEIALSLMVATQYETQPDQT